MRTALIGITLVIALTTLTPCADGEGLAPVRRAVVPLAPPELDAALKSGAWLIVEFGGEHCIPCKAMQPILQDLQLALEGKARVHNFWIQQHPEVARRHRIMLMPTQVVFNTKGEEVLRHEGVWPAEELQAALQKAGVFK